MRGIIPAVLLSLSVGTAHGQFFTNYGAEQGLGNQDLIRLVQDDLGNLWMTSQEGTWRFDGEHFKRFDLDRPVGGTGVRDLAEGIVRDAAGGIWIASRYAGLLKFDRATEHWLDWEELTGDTLVDQSRIGPGICALSEDSILVCGIDRGLLLYLVKERRVQLFELAVPGVYFHVGALVRDQRDRNRVWVGGYGSLYHLDLDSAKLVSEPIAGVGGVDRSVHVWDIDQQRDGSLLCSTWGDGTIRYDPATRSSTHWLFDTLPPLNGAKNVQFAMTATGDGSFWVGTHRGLRRFATTSGFGDVIGYSAHEPHSIAPGWVKDVLLDAEGNLWCATRGGLSVMARGQNRFHDIKFGPLYYKGDQQPSIRGAVELGDRFLLGTDIIGLHLVDKRTGEVRHLPVYDALGHPITDRSGWELFNCRGGPIHYHTTTGMYLLDPATGRLTPEIPRTIARYGEIDGLGFQCDSGSTIWTGARHGLYRTDFDKDSCVSYDPRSSAVRRVERADYTQGIAHDQAGNTWFNILHQGLGRIPPSGGPVRFFTPADSKWLPTAEITDLDIDRQDRLWIGTIGHGLLITDAKVPGGPGSRILSNAEGMASVVNNLLLTPKGDLWSSGNNGLYRISHGDLSVKHFDADDGLSRTNFNDGDLRMYPSGSISISAYNTFIWFHPDSLEVPLVAPHVWLDGASVNGVPLRRDSTLNALPQLTLPHDSNYVDIRFSAIALTQRHRIALEYRLVGNSERWVRTEASGTAIFTGLPPGAYTFEVRAADLPDAPVTTLAITIVPAFWQSTWFKALIITLVLAGTTFAVRWRLRTVRAQERLRSDFERRIGEVEMSALRAQMNPHFLFNSLNSINRYIVKHEPRIASEYLTKFSRLMRSVLNNSKEKLVPLKDDLDALLLYIDLESLRFTNRFELVSSIELEEDPGSIMVPPLLLQPYVENAIWHGLMHKKEGAPVLKVSIHQHTEVLRCEVEDNGLGRAHAAMLRSRSTIQRESMGTRITQDRLDLLKRLYNMDVSVVYTDLMDAAQRPLGTRVTLTLQRQPRV